MRCQYVNNGRLFNCEALAADNNRGFKEVAIRITKAPRGSILYSAGTVHWVLPSTLFPHGVSKQKRGCVETKIGAVALSQFRAALPKFGGER